MNELEIRAYLSKTIHLKDPGLLCLKVQLMQLDEIRKIRESIEGLADQFDSVSGGGNALMVEP